MGRPPTKPKRFKDGFYIEVRNKGANAGMKIHFDTEHEMKDAAIMYGTYKEVVILGEHKRDRWLNLEPAAEEKRVKKMRLDRPREAPNKYVRGAKPAKAAEPVKEAKKEKPIVTAFIAGHVPKMVDLKPDLVIGFSDIQAQNAHDLIKAGLNVGITNQRSLNQIMDNLQLL